MQRENLQRQLSFSDETFSSMDIVRKEPEEDDRVDIFGRPIYSPDTRFCAVKRQKGDFTSETKDEESKSSASDDDKENVMPSSFSLLFTPLKSRTPSNHRNGLPRSPFLDITPKPKKSKKSQNKSSGRRKLLLPHEVSCDPFTYKTVKKMR